MSHLTNRELGIFCDSVPDKRRYRKLTRRRFSANWRFVAGPAVESGRSR
jgi:hypothetical protein